jgi:hypothetical protein
MGTVPPRRAASYPAGWYVDPWRRADFRYWDGSSWTQHVSTAGVQSVDPLPSGSPPAPAGPAAAAPAAEPLSIRQEPVSSPAESQPAVQRPADDSPAPRASEKSASVPLFRSRSRARELAGEVDELRAQVQRLSRLDVLTVAQLEQRRDELEGEIAEQQARLELDRAAAVDAQQQQVAELAHQRAELAAQVQQLRVDVITTEEEAVLQEVGVYEYRHPLTDVVAYQAALQRIRDQIKLMTRKDGGAVLGNTNWTVNGSAAQGRTMVRDFSKLMLRAYNAEADNLIRSMKPYKLDSSIDRLTKVATTIVKLGRTMDIRISDRYHALRIQELELTADCLERQAEQKEHEREERERLREERKVQQEMERERARLEKEHQHYVNALQAVSDSGDEEATARLQEQLADVRKRIDDVDYRAANVRAGYVYVISNVGSFGERMVKVGLTRRLDPLDRVRELGDASVPFRFDVHALFFSKDAVGIETRLRDRLADRRVNEVNRRREFFYATPTEVKAVLVELTPGELLEFQELPEAVEYRQSLRMHENGAPAGDRVPAAPPPGSVDSVPAAPAPPPT